jgi:TRAP-type mannitol/chloroaromatic compound transport system substrate-binding protein
MPMGEISVNKQRWDALSPDLKAIVEAATEAFALAMIQRNYLADQTVAVEKAKRGFEPIDLSPVERQKFREIARGVWKEYASRSPMAQKMYDSQVAFLQRLGLLKE